MTYKEMLLKKYTHYRNNGGEIIAITLSTYVKSEAFAKSARFSSMWNNHVMHKIKDKLPYKLKSKIDHNYLIELSKDGFYHYHGIIALPGNSEKYIFKNSCLKRCLTKDFSSFSKTGKYRYFRINDYLVEPCHNVYSWINYITKTTNYIADDNGYGN